MTVDLEGRRALVTGGGTGIGFGCARELALAGARVTIAGRRGEVLDDAAARLRDEGLSATPVVCVVTYDDTPYRKRRPAIVERVLTITLQEV